MKKVIQKEINQNVEKFIEDFNNKPFEYHSFEKLRSCNARVYISNKYYVLQSYDIIVAAIDRDNCCGYDFLRYVYGYTATSAKHISAFFHDYLWSANCPESVYTWRAC